MCGSEDVRGQEVRGQSILMQCVTTMSKEDSVQMTAVGGGKQSGSFRCGRLQALDPGLALHTHIADKSYINLAKQKSCSFNILMSTCFAWDLS